MRCLHIMSLCLSLCSIAVAQPDFTSITSAEMLVVTHDNLRTPGWTPDSTTAWEGVLLNQKQGQGISVAMYDIADGVSASTIRSYIQSNGPELRYVFIIGDADHLDVDPSNPSWPASSSSSMHFVPLYGEIVDPGVFYVNEYALENDFGFIDGRPELTIGRLPAQSRTEISTYLTKCSGYLSAGEPPWAKKQLCAFDDATHVWTSSYGPASRFWANSLDDQLPVGWTNASIFATDFNSQAARDSAFRVNVNGGQGLIVSLGAGAHMNNLSYFMTGTSSYSFSNEGEYPLLLGYNCSIAAFQRPDSVDNEIQPWHYYYDYNVVEKLLFCEDCGIIAAFGPTQWTIFDGDYLLARKTLNFLLNDNIRSFGELHKRVVSLKDGTGDDFRWEDFQYENIVLLGDPSLRYPLGIEPCGTWTTDISPVIVDDTLHIPSNCTLTIEAGVEVLFDNNARMVVDDSAKLVVNGTSSEPVVFRAKDSGEKWIDIWVDGGALDMDHAIIRNSKAQGIFTDDPWESGSTTPVRITNCYFHGGDLVAGAPALRLWGSPSFTQVVANTVVDSVPVGTGLYTYNCYVDFDNDTIRGCSYVNSYVKKTSGSFRGCVFNGRTSNYGVLFNSATCNPNITCSKFLNLAAPSGSFKTTVFSATGCSPTFAGTTIETGRSNVIEDTSAYLLTIEGTGLRPTIVKNDWLQRSATGKFMEWRSYPGTPTAFDVDNQYWSSTPSTAKFTPANASYWDWTPYEGSAYGVCGGDGGGSIVAPGGDIAGRGGSLDDPSPEESLFAAIDLEANEDFEGARSAFQALVFADAPSDLRWRAMLGCITTDVRCASQADWLVPYMDSLRTLDGASYDANLTRGRLLYSHLLNKEHYTDAINECNSLLLSGLQFSDSVNVAIDLLGIQMAAGLIEDDGRLDNGTLASLPSGLRVESFEDGLEKERRLVQLLGRGSLDSDQGALPTSYALYQNYPNPFNPNTEIRFDIPEAVQVELKIFNILGQEVTTLADDVRAAGAYRILWDGRNAGGLSVASGVYVYQLKAGNFQDAKKMVLIK